MLRASSSRRPAVALRLAAALAVVLSAAPGSARAAAPSAVTLASPANGSFVSGGQPRFSGTAAAGNGQVTVSVYSGGSTSGTPVEQLSAPVDAGGGWSATPAPPLADGTYTAQASQSGPAGSGATQSDAATFIVYNAAPAVELDQPRPDPQPSSTPALHGVAGTAPGDAPEVTVAFYAGTTTATSPAAVVSGPVAADGEFLIAPQDALPDGTYTAVAGQQQGSRAGYSATVSFAIKAEPPALTLYAPRTGASVDVGSLLLYGLAGDVAGDLEQVTVTIHQGADASGRRVGAWSVNRAGGFWELSWPDRLAPGLYTAVASQADAAGNVARASSTFMLVPPLRVIGGPLDLAQNGLLRVPIGCPAPTGTCSGTVTAVSSRALRDPGGRRAPLRLIRTSFVVPAGRQLLVAGRVRGWMVRALRRAGPQPVLITVRLSSGIAYPGIYRARRTVAVAG